MAGQLEEVNLDKLGIVQLEQILKSPDDPTKGKIWLAWHYLQVYATWGLRLPSTPKDLQDHLRITNPADYGFFNHMQGAYETIKKSSVDFHGQTLSLVDQLFTNLKEYAEDSRSSDNSAWTLIEELVADEDGRQDALDVITDMQISAERNAAQAKTVADQLNKYYGQLVIASSQLERADTAVQKENKTSQATINQLQGGPEVMGSIKQLQALADTQNEAYQKNTAIAATTVTYAWVPVIGAIAAAVVAGIYGDAAVKALRAYDSLIKKIEQENKNLLTAVKANEVQRLANIGIVNAKTYTQRAIDDVTTVRNAWSDIAADLRTVKQKIDFMTKESDGQEVLKSQRLILRYCGQARKAWDSLWPAIKELADQPYIKMEKEEKTVDQMINEVEMALAS